MGDLTQGLDNMHSGRRNSFFKGHALGNDYIVMDPANLDCRLDPSTIRAICDRNRGVGGDGIIGIGSSSRADFCISIYNADGSEAETSGNGLRIFGLYALHSGRATENDFSVETKAGISRVRLETGPDGYVSASASMGRASFRPSDLPYSLDVQELISQGITVQGRRLNFTGVSVGNPHCVVFVEEGEEWTRDDLLSLGPEIESHPLFPNRVNVQLASVESERAIKVMIWERGSGETLASGSSSCAAASACSTTRSGQKSGYGKRAGRERLDRGGRGVQPTADGPGYFGVRRVSQSAVREGCECGLMRKLKLRRASRR